MDKCELCGLTEKLQEHHTSYEPEVIQILCVGCHILQHGHGVGKAGKHLNINQNKICIRFKNHFSEEEYIKLKIAALKEGKLISEVVSDFLREKGFWKGLKEKESIKNE